MTMFEVTDITNSISKISQIAFKAIFEIIDTNVSEDEIQKNWNEFSRLDIQGRIYWLKGNKSFRRAFEIYAVGWNDRPNCNC